MMRIQSYLPALLWSAVLLVGAPAGAAELMRPDLASLGAVPHYQVDGASAAAGLQALPQRRGQPLHFAAGVALPLTLEHGHWDALDGGQAAWRVRVGSPGAKLINFEFEQFRLPPSGRLYIYDAEGRLVQGPYTAANQTPEGRLWTAVVEGEEAVIELRVSQAERPQVRLALGTVYHGFLSFSQAAAEASGLTGSSAAACEVNVACPAGDNWGNEIRSTAVFSVADKSGGVLGIGATSGEILCSGDLVNNVRQDGTPYFLTAHHCQAGWSSSSPASSMVVYWNYQAASCSGATGSLADNQTGAIFDATDAGSDFNLLTLSQQPSGSFNVHFAGWDVSGNAPQSGVGIHHPQADIKKISTYASPAAATPVKLCLNQLCTQSQTVQAWEVSWVDGITEPGSSGSGLWDQNHHLVGVLSGGNSACPSNAGGQPSGNDFYGRLNVAWTANSTGGPLKQWLDPDNTGTVALDGKDPGGSNGSSSSGSGGGGGSSGGGALPPLLILLLAPLALLRRLLGR